tara:strand:- start:42 stop:299 length:258 start_codon:yes stop_codon:yes gene_type:complete
MSINQTLWKPLAISAISILVTSASAFIMMADKPTVNEVSKMIEKEAPQSIKNELREIKLTQKTIEISMAKQAVQLDQVLEKLKSM